MLISQLGPEDRKKALEYRTKYTDNINAAFIWDKTPEGYDYWQNLYRAPFVKNKKPSHYDNKSNYDVIDFCNDNNLNFNRGSAVKYIPRAGKKQYDGLTMKESEIADIKKAIDFLQREIKFLENE